MSFSDISDSLTNIVKMWLIESLLLCFDDGGVSTFNAVSVKRKRRRARMLPSQSWMMKSLCFRMTQMTVTTRHRVRGTLISSAFTWPRAGSGEFSFKWFAAFAFSGAEEEEGLSSDEEVPFRDDLNDQSYDPKAERCVCVCVCVWHY